MCDTRFAGGGSLWGEGGRVDFKGGFLVTGLFRAAGLFLERLFGGLGQSFGVADFLVEETDEVLETVTSARSFGSLPGLSLSLSLLP